MSSVLAARDAITEALDWQRQAQALRLLLSESMTVSATLHAELAQSRLQLASLREENRKMRQSCARLNR